jgi:hypothetical protein
VENYVSKYLKSYTIVSQNYSAVNREGSLLIRLSQTDNLELKDPLRSYHHFQPESIIKKILTKISTYKTRNELDSTDLL